jgi:hypothetical protein
MDKGRPRAGKPNLQIPQPYKTWFIRVIRRAVNLERQSAMGTDQLTKDQHYRQPVTLA